MSELSSSTLLLAAFVLPGYFFCSFLLRHNFPLGRPASSKITLIISSAFISMLLLALFDLTGLRFLIGNLLFEKFAGIHENIVLKDGYQFISKSILESFSLILFSKDQSSKIGFEEYRFVFNSLIFYFGSFCVLATYTTSVIVGIFQKFARLDFQNFLFTVSIHTEWFIKKKPFDLWKFVDRKIESLFPNWKYTVDSSYEKICKKIPGYYLFAALFAIIIAVIAIVVFIFFVASIILSVIIFAITSNIVLWIFNKFINIFSHPAEKLFYLNGPDQYKVCIVEILNQNSVLVKGQFVSFEPKNQDEIGALTIKNVIQYSKPDTVPFFLRKSRTTNEFTNKDSQLTVPITEIKNFNAWTLDQHGYQLAFAIIDQDSVTNFFWYLKILIQNNKYDYNFSRIKPQIAVDQIPIFFNLLLELIESEYSDSIFYYKRISLYNEYRSLLKEHLKIHRRLSQSNPADAKKSRKHLLRSAQLFHYKYIKIK